MKDKLILIFTCFTFFTLYGQKIDVKNTSKPTTNISAYLMHVVKFGETLTKISKIYGVAVTDILNTNPSLTENSLMPDQIIRISNKGNKKILNSSVTKNNELKPKESIKQDLKPRNIKYHIVEPGQTMYAVSKMYNITVEELQKWNNIKDFNLKVGSQVIVMDLDFKPNPKTYSEIPVKQVLKTELSESKPREIKKDVQEKVINDIDENIETEIQKPDIQASDNETQKDLAKIFKEKISIQSIQSTKGTGAPMTTSLGAMETVYFAMHKWLPIGTIIKIKNLVNSKIVYAKVIGKLPDIDENKHVIVRYSLGVKKDLQLQNGKCYLQIEYPD